MDEQSKLRQWGYRVADRSEAVSWDLLGTVFFAVVTAAYLSVSGVQESFVAPVLGLPLLLFLPGYVIVAALFPRRKTAETMGQIHSASIGLSERAALSFAVSLIALPPLSLVWWAVGPGLKHIPAGIAAFVCLGSALAFIRRYKLPSGNRFRLPVGRWTAELRGAVTHGTRADRSVNTVLLLSVLLATASIGFALAVPNGGSSYSSLYLGTENEAGELTASGYPTELQRNESATLTVGVKNREGAQISYTVVAELQRVERTGETLSVRDTSELDRFEFTIGADETWELQHSITPRMEGDNLRLQYSLYKGTVGANPSADATYRTTYLWVTVSTADR